MQIENLSDGNIHSTGVGLREGEIKALDAIGEKLGHHLGTGMVARNALMRLAIRRFLEAYIAGGLDLRDLERYFEQPEEPRPKLVV